MANNSNETSKEPLPKKQRKNVKNNPAVGAGRVEFSEEQDMRHLTVSHGDLLISHKGRMVTVW